MGSTVTTTTNIPASKKATPVKQNALEGALTGGAASLVGSAKNAAKDATNNLASASYVSPNQLDAGNDDDGDKQDLTSGCFPGMFIEGLVCCIPPLGKSVKSYYKAYLAMAGWKRAVIQFLWSTALGLSITAVFTEVIFDEWKAFADAPEEMIALPAAAGPVGLWLFDKFTAM